MKKLLPPLFAGAGIALLLYGLLWAAERRLPESEDPWLDAWIGEGMKAEFQSLSTEPGKHLMNRDLREFFKAPEYAGSALRIYLVQNAPAQVLRLPRTDGASKIPQGRSLDFRLTPEGKPIHVCRSGRTILVVATKSEWIPFVDAMKTSKREVEKIFDVFEETAGRYP